MATASTDATWTRPDGVTKATGRSREDWFTTLDTEGMRGRPYRETATYLADTRGLSRWWAQKITVEYEQSRGQRAPGVRPDGTFTVTATKTVAVPVDRAFAAFADATQRKRWLRDLKLRSRASDAGRSIRFECTDDATRVHVTFRQTTPGKAQVAIEHARIADPQTAARQKTVWRDRLSALKATVES
jgi:hypothetical protein